jgi:phosphonate transport system substrate-binding protein
VIHRLDLRPWTGDTAAPKQRTRRRPAPPVPWWWLAVALWLMPGWSARAQTPPLEFGLAPYISVRPMMTLFEPMAAFLEKRLGRSVLLVTAPSLREFDARVLAGRYELAMLAPQAARLAQREAGYVPLLRVSDDLYGVFLVPEESPLRSLRELGHAPIAFPDRFTETAHLGREAVAALGVTPDWIVYAPGFQDSLPMSLRRGEHEVALMNGSAFYQMKPEQKEGVRVLGETQRIAHVMFLVHPRTPAVQQALIRDAIQEFWLSPEGQRFGVQSGLTGVRPPTEEELKTLDPLAREHKRLLDETRNAEGEPQ